MNKIYENRSGIVSFLLIFCTMTIIYTGMAIFVFSKPMVPALVSGTLIIFIFFIRNLRTGIIFLIVIINFYWLIKFKPVPAELMLHTLMSSMASLLALVIVRLLINRSQKYENNFWKTSDN